MNENFKINDHDVVFKYLGDLPVGDEKTTIDGYRALFVVDSKYKIYFEISDTKYNSYSSDHNKSLNVFIDEKFGNLKNCFKKIGMEYLIEKISQGKLKDKNILLTKYLISD